MPTRSQFHLWRTDRPMSDGTFPPGYGPEPPEPFPDPILLFLSPSSAFVGGVDILMTANGANFTPGSVVWFDGLPLSTNYMNEGQLSVLLHPVTATPGSYDVEVRDGNKVSNELSFVYNQIGDPVLNTLSPSTAIIDTAPFIMACNGADFSVTSVIWFDGVALTTTFDSITQVTATVNPAGATPGLKPVQVKDGVRSSAIVSFVYTQPSLVLTSLNPSTAQIGTSDVPMEAIGTGFTPTSVIWLNGVAKSTTYNSPTKLTMLIQPSTISAPGTQTVQIKDGARESSILNFTFTPADPILSNVTPTTAQVNSANFTLTANGSWFTVTSVIWFNGIARTTNYVSPTQITCVLSPATFTQGVKPVQVRDGARTSGSVNFTFTQANPILTSVSPNTSVTGAANLTLTATGSFFTATSKIWFDGVEMATTVVSGTSLTCTITPSTATAGTKLVQVKDGALSSGTVSFTYTAPVANDPVLNSISPNTKNTTDADFVLTCNGSEYTPSSVIFFNSVAQTTTYVSATQLTCTVATAGATAGTRPVQVKTGVKVSAILNFTYTTAAVTESMFFNGAAPGGTMQSDTVGQSLGMRVDPLVNGAITKVAYYRPSALSVAYGWVGLWDRDGTLLQAVQFTDHTTVGWKTVPFRLRTQMLSSRAYVIGVWLIRGGGSTRYMALPGVFASAGLTVSGKMTAPQDNDAVTRGYAQKNGLYTDNVLENDFLMPVNSFGDTNYFVDLGFTEGTFPAVPLDTYPNARNTGHVGALAPVSGDVALTTPGEVYQNKDITGQVWIAANNVTIQNCRIRFNGGGGVIMTADGVTGTKIYNNTIDGLNNSDGVKGIWGSGHIKGNNIFGCEDGMYLKGTPGQVIEDNYVHDLSATSNVAPHFDGISGDYATSNMIIRHNTVLMPTSGGVTAAIALTDLTGSINTALIEDNLCYTSNMGVLIDARFTTGADITNVTIKDNIYWGPPWTSFEVILGTATAPAQSGATWIKAVPFTYFQ